MKNLRYLLFLLIMGTIVLSSCASAGSGSESKQKLDYAETVFQARLFQPLAEGETLYFELVDEITGIALNPTRYKMEAIGSAEFTVRMPLPVGSLVRYRYVRDSAQNVIEKDAKGEKVLYRLYKVTGPGQVNDVVASWDEQKYIAETGEISGFIYDVDTEAPLGEILVAVNGQQTYTSFNGFFIFENVPTGEFPIVAVHPDGLYEVFQQNAVVAGNSVTPATFGMKRSKQVKVTFEVHIPEDTHPNAVIRMLGNLHRLGSSFSELADGTSIVPSITPVLEHVKDDLYSVSLELPAGLDLRYKYSIGDGFVNAEHAADSTFKVRQLIVPGRDTIIRDQIESWYSSGSAPVQFRVAVPPNTPTSDSISIQFNPYAWMQPIPMWKNGENEWTYTLYGPFDYLDQSQYRFCRNEACGISDDAITRGVNGLGYLLDLTNGTPLTINYQIAQWHGLEDVKYNVDTSATADNLLIKGFQMKTPYDPKWAPHLDKGMIEAAVNGGNWIFFNPTWTFESDGSARLNPGLDPMSTDIRSFLRLTNDAGLNFALYPQLNAEVSSDRYWNSTELTYNWWQRWFTNYQRFVLNYADFASQHGINTIIIGGKSVSPAFPNGKLPNGSFSNTPYNFSEQWDGLISEIRSRYSGQVGFAIPYSDNLDQLPEFISKVDFLYVEMSSALTDSTTPKVRDMQSRVSSILDNEVYKLYAIYQKPVILSIDYSALDGSASDCLNLNASCGEILNMSTSETLTIDTYEQADVYYSFLQESAARSWIMGLISDGFNPSVAVQDVSSSVHGKPAMQVLSAFFN